MKNIIVTILIITSFNVFSQKLLILDEFDNADIDSSKFELLQTIDRGNVALDSIFKPIEGIYKVKRYLIDDSLVLESGPNAMKQKVTFVLILKIDNENQIVDGYYYNLFNSEYAYCALNRIKKPKKKISLI